VIRTSGFVARRLLLLGIVIGAATGAAGVLVILGVIRWWWCSFLALGLVVAMDRLTRRGRRLDPYTWSRGVDGEGQVAVLLKTLEPLGFQVFGPIDVGHGDVDHVAVGPTGVFAIETKNWPGVVTARGEELLRNGRPEDAVKQAVRGAIAIRKLTRARWVEAILVCVNAKVDQEPIKLTYATVTSAARLTSLIADHAGRLSAGDVATIARSLGARSASLEAV
jgi:hypothetical protein